MKTFIQRQEECIARMLEARTSERRASKNRLAAIRKFRKELRKLGYTESEVSQATTDILDMYQLEVDAE